MNLINLGFFKSLIALVIREIKRTGFDWRGEGEGGMNFFLLPCFFHSYFFFFSFPFFICLFLFDPRGVLTPSLASSLPTPLVTCDQCKVRTRNQTWHSVTEGGYNFKSS